MITYTKTTIEQKSVASITCDVCKVVHSIKVDGFAFETQEFLHINLRGGYGSVFGDESTIKCDICQHCLKRLLGEYIRVDEE